MFCLAMWLAFRHASTLTSSLSLVEVEALPSHRVLLSRWSSVVWPPPTSHPASSWTSPLRLIPFVTVDVGHRPDEISPVPSPTFTTSRSPYAGGFLAAAFPGSSPLPWPSLCYEQLSSLLSRFRVRISTLQDSLLCYGLLLCFPFSGSCNASAQPVTRLHRLPATWPPVSYHDRTCTG